MPKFLCQASYTTRGIEGMINDSATGRRADLQATVRALGGKIEALYYAFGEDDVVMILDLPSSVTAAALSLRTQATGMVRVRMTSLLTVEEMDQALEVKMQYRAPGE
jgi:uncharacterized protein with GYD domain